MRDAAVQQIIRVEQPRRAAAHPLTKHRPEALGRGNVGREGPQVPSALAGVDNRGQDPPVGKAKRPHGDCARACNDDDDEGAVRVACERAVALHMDPCEHTRP